MSKSKVGRPRKKGASLHSIRVTDAVWRAYERFGEIDGKPDATRGIELAALFLERMQAQLKDWIADNKSP
jgi:hypothetical protein